ncbi:CCC motif membrane protein [Flavobacterium sp. JP2137]|uniref:CCC motif membrane protein n=1 Tax=Flavobacterium sp. JP2137 TaxID=3414510 RepID=UPI003D2FB2D6
MDQQFTQKLPHSDTVLVLGISSLVMCCCWGVGLIPAIIGLFLAHKSGKLYQANPSGYSGYKNLNTGKVLCIIALILGSINLMINLYITLFFGAENFQQMLQDFQTQLEQQQ